VTIYIRGLLVLLALVAGSSLASSRTIDPIVSTGWLSENINVPDVIVLDVRSADRYLAGHIPGALNEPFVVPFSAWITMNEGLLLELPEVEGLFETLGHLGIAQSSKVVIVSDPSPGEPPHYGLAAATRVADTLIYLGVNNVAILDGGYTKWSSEERGARVEVVESVGTVYDGDPINDMFVSLDYVLTQVWRVNIIDARDADVYFGVTIEPFAAKPGHIFTAKSLPAPWAYDLSEDNVYTFKDREILDDMVAGVLRLRASKQSEIVVYCGVGGYTSIWWYLLTQVLGYENVKFYDGSAQEWAKSFDLVPYRWR